MTRSPTFSFKNLKQVFLEPSYMTRIKSVFRIDRNGFKEKLGKEPLCKGAYMLLQIFFLIL